MHPQISKIPKPSAKESVVFLVTSLKDLPKNSFSVEELAFIGKKNKSGKQDFFSFNRLSRWCHILVLPKAGEDDCRRKEEIRKSGDRLGSILNEQKVSLIQVTDVSGNPEETLAFTEGLVLGQYRFLKYKGKKKSDTGIEKIQIVSRRISDRSLQELAILTRAVYMCRTLINEPNSYLTAKTFSQEVAKMASECGAKAEILNRKKIEALQMGGLLAVNKGSKEPPTFTILEWKPQKPVNRRPVVLVGKGIVFDSGGMNLKPGESMSTMKDDMSGAAAVACALYAIAAAKLPVHVISLMPATDNRPGPDAIVPGDIITMQNGTTVEVLNTDAEGRLILADALSYASKYRPSLVIDLATLTGAAVRAVGKYAIVAMQTKAEKELEKLKISGFETWERLVEFPSWEDYSELIQSELADLKNIGPGEAGAITAGVFLEKFASFPFIHLDIAGPAFLDKRDSYRGKGGTGTGVRLLFDFIRKQSRKAVQ